MRWSPFLQIGFALVSRYGFPWLKRTFPCQILKKKLAGFTGPSHLPSEALGNYGRKKNWNEVRDGKGKKGRTFCHDGYLAATTDPWCNGKWFVANLENLSSHLGRIPAFARSSEGDGATAACQNRYAQQTKYTYHTHQVSVNDFFLRIIFLVQGLVGVVLLGSFQACAIHIPAAPDGQGKIRGPSPSHCSVKRAGTRLAADGRVAWASTCQWQVGRLRKWRWLQFSGHLAAGCCRCLSRKKNQKWTKVSHEDSCYRNASAQNPPWERNRQSHVVQETYGYRCWWWCRRFRSVMAGRGC